MFVQTQNTPNPNSLKFLPSKKVSNDDPFEITDKNKSDNELVKNILSINGVTGIFLAEDFLSENKDEKTNWEDLKHIIKLNGKNRCLINAYGSYGMSYLSFFSIPNYRFIKNGGIVVFAHLRGGGEKGEEWHKAGQKALKHNTWKDLISAGEYLISKKYTSTPYLACQGTSAGGIAVGMAANERPDLFNSIISNVGSNTVIRKGRNPTGGFSEFGNPSIEEEFHNLLKMDVFQNIKCNVAYPNMLFTAGKEDGRVDYWKPAKACAKMKKCTSSINRIDFILLEKFAHGNIGASRKDSLKYMAKQFAFLELTLKK